MARRNGRLTAMTELIVRQLANFVAGTRPGDIPDAIRAKARLHILDTVGAALAGATSAEATLARAALLRSDGPGTETRLSPRSAALVNGIAAHAFELDDTGGCDHSGAVVLPALMAALLLSNQPVDGPLFVTATVLGYDIGRRVMEGFGGYVPHNSAGWHSTGTCGVFAASASVASLLRLDPNQTAHALGLAASSSSGLWAFIHDGAMAKRVHAGRAAESGLLAALLAREGITGPAHAFEDVWGGFLKTYGHGPVSPDAMVRDLGHDWMFRHAAIKPYASCRDTHAAVDAIGRVLIREALDPAAIVSVRARLSPFLDGMVGGRDVATLPAAQMSLSYAVAARILYGTAGLEAYSAERRSSSEIAAFLPRIAVELDEGITASWYASITVETADGRSIEEATTIPLGAPENPLPIDRLRMKYDGLAALSLPASRADALAEAILGLESESDVSRLLTLLQGVSA